MLLTDVAGVKDKEGHLIQSLSRQDLEPLIADGTTDRRDDPQGPLLRGGTDPRRGQNLYTLMAGSSMRSCWKCSPVKGVGTEIF
jgi:hypothetical protein